MDNRIKNKTGTLGSMFWQFPANAEPLILNKTLCHFRFDAGFNLRLIATVALLGAYLPTNLSLMVRRPSQCLTAQHALNNQLLRQATRSYEQLKSMSCHTILNKRLNYTKFTTTIKPCLSRRSQLHIPNNNTN